MQIRTYSWGYIVLVRSAHGSNRFSLHHRFDEDFDIFNREHDELVLQNCQDRWKWGLHGIFLSFLDVFGPLIPNLDDAKSYLLSILRYGWKKSIFGKNIFFYIFNKVEAGFLFVIGWSWFYRSFCIKIKNIAYDRFVFNDKSVILRTFVIKVRCAIYLYFIVFANTFSTNVNS